MGSAMLQLQTQLESVEISEVGEKFIEGIHMLLSS
jgi:hypothetical protein